MPALARAASDVAEAPHVRLQLLVPGDSLATGKAGNPAGLFFKLEPGWHIYWSNPGDAGAAPSLRWSLPASLTTSPLGFPAPRLLPLGTLMDYGYEGEVILPFRITASAASSTPVVLHAHAEWLVCRDSCLPGRAELEISRTITTAHPAALPANLRAAEASLPKSLPPSASVSFVPTATGFRLIITTGKSEAKAHFFPAEQDQIDNPAPQKIKPTPTGCELELKRDAVLTGSPAQLKGVIQLAGGRNYVVVARAGKTDAASASASAPAAAPLSPENAVQGSPSAAPSAQGPQAKLPATASQTGSAPAGQGTQVSLGKALTLAFLGGIILNLMPCVFPVLFLKGLSLVNSGKEDRRSLRLHGAIYTLGILVSLWALAGVLEALRAAGAVLGWGFQFQSPAFVLLLSGLLFLLALSLAGLFEIGLSLTSAGGELANRQGFAGSFFTGILAVVVATPCTAPMMGVAMGFALAASPAVALLVFTALALGLAAPYVALTLQPAWTRFLPRPGAWMELLRQAVSIPLFATVIWLSWVLVGAAGAGIVLPLLGGMLLLAIAGWFWGRWPLKRWAKLVGLAFLLAVILLDLLAPRYFATAPQDSAQATAQESDGWQPWSEAAQSAALAAHRPVFVDYTASWCLSCQVNQRVALDRPEVMAAFRAKHVLLLKADWTRRDEAITRSLQSLGRSGVPDYAFYRPGASQPELLPEALTPSIVLAALNSLP